MSQMGISKPFSTAAIARSVYDDIHYMHVHVKFGGLPWNATACSYSTYISVVAITHSTHVRNVKMYTLKGDDQGWRYCFHCLFV